MNIELLQKGLEKSENVGADFLEIRYDDLQLRTLLKENETWKEIQSKRRRGIGVASYVKGVMGYSSTAILTVDAIKQASVKATKIALTTAEISSIDLSFSQEKAILDKPRPPFQILKHPSQTELTEKIELIDRGMEIGREAGGDQVSMVKGMYGEIYGKKLFVNSEGSQIDWDYLITDLRFSVVAKGTGGLVSGQDGFGGSHGLERFENGYSPETLASNAGTWAKEQLNAKSSPAGNFRCLAEERLVGVLAHESFGHLSEADFIVSRGSPLTDRLGESIANDVVSIYDIGEPDISKYGGLWLPYDDQGSKTMNTQIVDKGVLKGYLNTRGTASYFEDVRTGNARSINFSFHPIPRMKNTYIAPGDYSHDEALEELKTGIYAIRTSGGQVDGNGEFLFKAMRGYYVENGEIKYPIKEVSLSGNILDLLKHIEGCTNSFKLNSGYFGGCGKAGQYPLAVGLGGPEVLFSKVRIGGESSKKKGTDIQMNF